MAAHGAQVHFEQDGSQLTAIQVVRDGRSPMIVSLQRVLFALGIVISSYQVRPGGSRLIERMVLERRDGGSIDGQLTAATKAAVLPLLLQEEPA